MTSQLSIKKLAPNDTDRWFALRIESLKSSPSSFLASPEKEEAQGVDFFRTRIAEGGDTNVIFGCFDGEEIVGCVGIVRQSHEKARHKATIWGMFVQPKYRGLKAGKRLMKQAIEFGETTMGVAQIDLSVESTQKAAKGLYTSLGFVKWGTEKNAMFIDGRYFDEEHMVLDLRRSL